MDFFVSSHNAQTAEDDRDNTEDFAKAIQQRFRPGAAPLIAIDPALLHSSRRLASEKTAGPPGTTGSAAARSKTARDSVGGSGSGNSGGMDSRVPAARQTEKQVQYPPEYFKGVTPAELATIDTFIVDIRPHAAYSSARIPGAVSLCVPTTLLKRPLFSLDRLAAMLPSDKSRQRFSKWRIAKKIVVYDADSSGNGPDGTLSEGSNIVGLLRKFASDDSERRSEVELLWLKGGFQTVWREARHLVETTSPPDEDDDENNPDSTTTRAGDGPGKPFFGSGDQASGRAFGAKPVSTLRPGLLPSSAFSPSSMVSKGPLVTPSIHGPRDSRPPAMSMSMGYKQPTMAANPFFDAIRQNQELLQGITERIPLRLPKRVRRRIDELPFQWLKDIGKRAGAKLGSSSDTEEESDQSSYESDSPEPHPVKEKDYEQDGPEASKAMAMASAIVPSSTQKSTSQSNLLDGSSSSPSSPGNSSDSLSDPDPSLVDEGMENLAMQFYRIELAEQRRLMGVMQHHTKESEVENQLAIEGRRQRMDAESEKVQQSNPSSTHGAGEMQVDDDAPTRGPRQRTTSSPAAPFPYSITAGVEKGAKNRYRHIWPFEHARVKLHQRRPDEVTPPPEATASTSMRLPFDSNPSIKPAPSSSSSPSRQEFTLSPNAPRFGFGGTNPPSGALTGTMTRARTRTPSPSKLSTITSTAGPGGFNLTLPLRKKRSSNDDAMPPPPPKFRPSMSIASSGSAVPLPSTFTQYRNTAAGSGGSGESTATESEWESGTDHKNDSRPSKKKETSAERRKAEESRKARETYDDYVNASYVQPLCTHRRYIATQGPLEATFTDFWTLVYQQNVHVIVMLTREVEGSMVKCGSYWRDTKYGPLQLKQISMEGRVDEEYEPQVGGEGGKGNDPGGFYFPIMPNHDEEKKSKKKRTKKVTIKERNKSKSSSSKNSASSSSQSPQRNDSTSSFPDLPIIKRTFELSHTSFPDVPPRRIVHLQYLDWPDMNIPDDTRGLLGLIKEVDKAVEEADVIESHPDDLTPEHDGLIPSSDLRFFDEDVQRKHFRKRSNEEIDRRSGIAKHALGRENAPVLLHCSAGVGRTGGFIAVDAVLDGIRRELRKGRQVKMKAEEKLERARLAMEARSSGDDVVMDGSSPSGSGSGSGDGGWNADIDMADATMDTFSIAAGHGGDTFHVAIHRETVDKVFLLNTPTVQNKLIPPCVEQDPKKKDHEDSSSVNLPPPTPMQVDVPLTAEEAKEVRKKQKEAADTSTRMWSQAVSDQTGHHGNARRVAEPQDSNSQSSALNVQIPPSHTAFPSTAVLDPEISSTSASDDSFGFASGFDKRFSSHGPSGAEFSEPYPADQGNSSSATSLSTGRGVGKEHRRTSSLARYLMPPAAMRDRTSSAPSGRPADMPSGIGSTSVDHDRLVVPRPAAALPRTLYSPNPSSSTSPWVLPDMSRRIESSPSPFSAADIPPPSRSLSPTGAANGSSFVTGGKPRLSAASKAPEAHAVSGPKSGSGSGSGSGSRSRSESASASASRSRSHSLAQSSPVEAGVLPTTGAGSSSLKGFDQKLDKAALAAAEVATSKLKSTHAHRIGFDYTEPRPLHQHESPQALSVYKDPLWEVIQDMREQRMSLCQSLRQYVFVHAVIVEGALMVLDEENAKDGIVRPKSRSKSKTKRSKSKVKSKTSRFASDEPMSDAQNADVASLPSTSRTTSGSSNKRLASPTELPQEDKKGGRLLHKKPSLKRKNGTSSDESLPRMETITYSPLS